MATGQQLQQAYEYILQGHREHAANMLTALLASDPKNADGWWLLAQAATDTDTVRYALSRFLALRPDDVRGQQMLASLGVRQQLDEARRASQELRAVTIPPAPPLEPRHPPLRRRYGLYAQPGTRSARLYPIVLLASVLFGLAGCALLVIAVLSGLRVVEQAVHDVLPALPLPFASGVSAEQPAAGVIPQGEIAYWQWRRGTLNGSGDQHAYTFTGGAGDFIVIEVSTVAGTLKPAVALYGPEGALIASQSDTAGTGSARLGLSLPRGGTFTILVTAAESGDYQIILQRN